MSRLLPATVPVLLALAACATRVPQVPDAEQLSRGGRERYVVAFEALVRDEPAAALAALGPLAALEQWHVPSHVLRQDALRSLGRGDEAAAWYSEESAKFPDDPRRLLLAARVGPRRRRARELAYRRAFAIDETLPWAALALTYELLRMAEEAAAEATSLLDRGYSEEAAEATTIAAGARQEALLFARRVADARPDLAAAHAALADALLADPGSDGAAIDEAVASAARAAALDAGNPARHALVAAARRRDQDDAGAAVALEAALDLRPRDPGLLGNAGRVYIDLDRPSDAVDVLERAVGIAPDDALLHMNLGVARHRENDLAGARASLQRACDLADGDPRPYEALALVLAEVGDPDGAVLAMNRYLELGGPARSSARRFIEELAQR